MQTAETFTAVRTTGIYCRPGCPATPLRRNTTPFPYAAAAEAAGYRPCLRCRPDRVPEPGWIDAPELVCRALRAISDGALDGATEDALAAQLGVSPRHLRRMFDAHVGATPSEVARSRRAHFARRLLDDTDLSIADVGFAAGFNSVRQMNRVMKEVFRFTPQELRARRRRPDRNVVDGGLDLQLPYRPPLAWDALLAFLAPRRDPRRRSGRPRHRHVPAHRRRRGRARGDRGDGEAGRTVRADACAPAHLQRAGASRRRGTGAPSTSTRTRRSSMPISGATPCSARW